MFDIPLATMLFAGGNFIRTGQNVHYNRLTYNELKRNRHVDERYHAEVLAALRGEYYNERIDTMHTLIGYIEKQIERESAAETEVFERTGELTTTGQNAINILLENREGLKKLMREHQSTSSPASATPVESHVKSYFGGE